ncbi:MAG: hypothetical protein DMG17_02815 [Acidobacteria bacterium]|nr:MAG: hypothetical protein DMG17_02815 [Acidobacteriota bacterium]
MKPKILIADDSPTIRRLVTQTFAEGSFEIVEVSNGEAAIKAFDEARPSIVLADIYMPGKNGYEVCSYVRSHATLGATPVILLVGAFDAFDEGMAQGAGATANITKPFEPAALIDLVKSLVSAEGRTEPQPEPEREIEKLKEPVTAAVNSAASVEEKAEDLLGLETIFKAEPEPEKISSAISDEDIDRIADRVIQRLSTQVIESIAWDIVPDITEKIVREELKRDR